MFCQESVTCHVEASFQSLLRHMSQLTLEKHRNWCREVVLFVQNSPISNRIFLSRLGYAENREPINLHFSIRNNCMQTGNDGWTKNFETLRLSYYLMHPIYILYFDAGKQIAHKNNTGALFTSSTISPRFPGLLGLRVETFEEFLSIQLSCMQYAYLHLVCDVILFSWASSSVLFLLFHQCLWG